MNAGLKLSRKKSIISEIIPPSMRRVGDFWGCPSIFTSVYIIRGILILEL